uniref:Chemokine ligand 32a n=1 Tax=Ctenopharyngodon idella TaxID=7959 RepID=A0A345D743_CTEID|nr:chemokine ligand 32a [Ctenopharyngodon idella]
MKSYMLGFYAVLLLWLLVSSSMQDNGHPGSGCLTTTDTKVHMKYLRSYKLQHKPLFPVDAVRFLTIKGNTICSDPSSPWAIKAMKYLNAKKKPQSGSNTAHKSVTAAPKKTSTINMTRSSAQIETQTSGRK